MRITLSYLYNNPRTLFLLLLLCVLIQCFVTYFRFSLIYTDSDQLILWNATMDFSKGVFHGPCFYGQGYNPLFEPLAALPLFLLGIDLYIALPLVTIIMGTSPYLILAFFLYKKISPQAGLLPLFVLLLLSPEFYMLTSISRGFVTGIFFTVIGFVILVSRSSIFFGIISGILFGIGLYANPNGILLYPLLLPFIYPDYRSHITKLIAFGIGFLIGLIPLLLNTIYYKQHPELIVFGNPSLKINLGAFKEVISSLDNYFDFISPLFWRFGWISLLFFIPASWHLWRNKRLMECFVTSSLFILIIISFSVEKVSEGANSVFFSGSRIFLSYPILLVFLVVYLLKTTSLVQKEKIFHLLIMLVVIVVPLKIACFDFFVRNAVKGKNSIVAIAKVNDLRNSCMEMLDFSDYDLSFIIANSPGSSEQLISYGCPCLIDDFPPTLQPLFERRTWLLSPALINAYKRILIHGKDKKIWSRFHIGDLEIVKSNMKIGWILIKNESDKRLTDLLVETGIRAR